MTDARVTDATDVPILVRLSPAEWSVYLLGVEHGHELGIDRGRALEAADLDADWATVAAAVRRAADVPTYAELQRRRGWVA